jgi:hypothetical protein
VFHKYRNLAEPAETEAGRGKQPRWLAAELRSGKKLDDFRIQPASHRARPPRGIGDEKNTLVELMKIIYALNGDSS